MEKVLIFGVTGQDGSYLSELLLNNGHNVIGVSRRTSLENTGRIKHILADPHFSLQAGDITDFGSVVAALQSKPDWVINLAAQSHVGTSFGQAASSLDITAQGFVNILEACRLLGLNPRIYQASSSEMFGDAYSECLVHTQNWTGDEASLERVKYQDINTNFNPRSPYAVAKMAAHKYGNLYRDAYGMHVRCGILFNHESPRRGEQFVTRKITRWLGEYVRWTRKCPSKNFYLGDNVIVAAEGGRFPKLRLGNLEARRDWGHAADYVDAMYKIMQHDEDRDWVVSTGDTYSIKEFLSRAFAVAGLGSWERYTVIDEDLMRPCEVPYLRGISDPIRQELGWEPKYTFDKLVREMVLNDIQ